MGASKLVVFAVLAAAVCSGATEPGVGEAARQGDLGKAGARGHSIVEKAIEKANAANSELLRVLEQATTEAGPPSKDAKSDPGAPTRHGIPHRLHERL